MPRLPRTRPSGRRGFFPSLPLRATLVLTLALAVSGCGLIGSDPEDPFDPDGPGVKTIRIEVLNLNFNDATLHAFRGGERHRLGIVTGKGEGEFTMEWPNSLTLRIEIDLLAGPSCITRALQVSPGEIIDLRIPVTLSRDPDCIPTRD